MTSFVNGRRGYLCGGSNGSRLSTVDIYYDTYETTYSANIPITEGSVFNLNNQSGTATESTIMSFDEKVTGTVKYKAGAVEVVGPYLVTAVFSGSPTDGAYLTISPSERPLVGTEVSVQAHGLSNITTTVTRSDGGTGTHNGGSHLYTFTMPENDVTITMNCTVRP